MRSYTLSEQEQALMARVRLLARNYPYGLIPTRAVAGLCGIGDLVDKGYLEHVSSSGANGPVHHYFRPRGWHT